VSASDKAGETPLTGGELGMDMTGATVLSMRVESYPGLVRRIPGVPNRCSVKNRPGIDSSEYGFPGFGFQGLIELTPRSSRFILNFFHLQITKD